MLLARRFGCAACYAEVPRYLRIGNGGQVGFAVFHMCQRSPLPGNGTEVYHRVDRIQHAQALDLDPVTSQISLII